MSVSILCGYGPTTSIRSTVCWYYNVALHLLFLDFKCASFFNDHDFLKTGTGENYIQMKRTGTGENYIQMILFTGTGKNKEMYVQVCVGTILFYT